MPLLIPDHHLSSVAAIDVEELATEGIRAVLVDLDNTLLPRDAAIIPDAAKEFVARVRGAGMCACLVSNNWHGRVSAVAAELGVESVSKAMKPLPFAFLLGLRRLGVGREQAVVVGDQLFTDVLGGNLLGMRTVLVPPLSRSDLPHTLLLRRLEARVLAGRSPIA